MNLQQELDRCGIFDAEFGGGLSNHLPMVLTALDRLGASPQQLQAFAGHYSAKLQAAPPMAPWDNQQGWTTRLGQPDAWSSYRTLFARWLAADGATAVLQGVVPGLLAGCGGAAFHGLIRTAYAVESGHLGELGDALAYWACMFLPLAGVPAGQEQDPTVLLGEIQVAMGGQHLDQPLIVGRMQAAARLPVFANTVARLHIGAATLPVLARHAARLYAQTGDFTVLHLVTSAHAMRVLLPYTGDPLPALSQYWCAFAAGVASSGVQAGPPASAVGWHVAIRAALASHDDHLVKLVYSCREEERVYGGDDWQLAASRAVAPADAARR